MVTVENVPDTIVLLAEVDTRHVAPDDVEALLLGMESAAVQAVIDPSADTGL